MTPALTLALTLAIALCAMLPGLIVARLQGRNAGELAAAAAASLVVMQLATALLGRIVVMASGGGLPALALVPVSLLSAAIAVWFTRHRGWASTFALPEWPGAVFAAMMVAFGLYTLALAFGWRADDTLLVHAWYNADWFKHMGHVHALADYGVPARDIFGNGGPLRYYWLSYVLPGAATAAGGDGWVALATTNAVVAWLFSWTLYGLIRATGPGPAASLALAIVGMIVIAPMIYAFDLLAGVPYQQLVDDGEAPGPALLIIPQVIPQHALATTVLLGWALSALPIRRSGPDRATGWLALVALAAIMTMSTLLGAMLLAGYGLTVLWLRRLRGMPELAAMAIASGALVLMLGVLEAGGGDTPINSPLFTNPEEGSVVDRILDGIGRLFGTGGAALVAALFVVRYWKPASESHRFLKTLALGLIAAAFACTVLVEAFMPPRVAIETVIRARIVFAIGVVIIGAWAIPHWWRPGGRPRLITGALLGLMLALALPGAIIRTAWYGNLHDRQTTAIPSADLQAMADLRRDSAPQDRVWQFPEPPYVSIPSGADMWVPIFAGRTVANSLRATDYGAARPYIERSDAFFAGEPVAIPADMDWVYLSRALHPRTYDMLVTRMQSDTAWQSAGCYADACLFSRRNSTRP